MKGGKIMAIGFSGILVVAVVVGVVVGVHKSNSSDKEKDVLSTTSKAVSAICSPTDYKQACVDSLGAVANNNSATPKDYLQAAIQYTVGAVKTALANTSTIGQGAKDSLNKMAVDDCKQLLQWAVDELQASFSMVGDSELHGMKEREAELMNWLSAVIAYQQTCIDGFNQTEIQKAMGDELNNATRLTENALAIVSSISSILSAFNIPLLNTTSANASASSQRRLLSADDQYPTWMSGADRKLLAKASPNSDIKPNAVVAKDGSGQYKTIKEALAAYPKNLQGRYIIYVKAGIYDEAVMVDTKQVNVFMYGDGPRKTMVTGKKNKNAGVSTFQTASFSALGDGFIAKGMGFQNTAGPEGEQAVALMVKSDRAAFYNCRMDGYQDTLYPHSHRNFYRNCVISGTVDFIFGDGATIIQNSLIIVRKGMHGQQNTITAHGRISAKETTGIVIQNCRIVPETKLYPERLQVLTYLGRPWKDFSRTVVMESNLGDLIQPDGWMPWTGKNGPVKDTIYYAEYANRGPGANLAKRVNWKGYHKISKAEAVPFTAGPFIQADEWVQATGAPYFSGLRF